MATEEPARVLTLKERIAALNLDSKPIPIGILPPTPSYHRDNTKKPSPLLPPRRPSQSTSAKPPPVLPPRRAADIILPTKLPALPERRPQKQADEIEFRLGLGPATSAPAGPKRQNQKPVLPPPSLPVKRRMPFPFKAVTEAPSNTDRSALQIGFKNPAPPPPIPTTRPQLVPSIPPQQPPKVAPISASVSISQKPGVIELDINSFDDVVLHSGKPTFIDFYAPFCKYCKDLDPIYEQLAIKYAHANITIAKINAYEHKSIGDTYEVKSWPTLKFFDGSGDSPVLFQWMRDMEWMSKFIDEQLKVQPTNVVKTSIIELDASSFDDVVLYSGKPAFVDFYAPFCKYCKNLDPIYEELAYKYSSRNITIAKIDSYGQKEIGDRYQIESWPTIKFFDGSGGPPIDYESGHDVEWMSVFIDEWLNKLPPVSSRSPQIPMTSRPDLAELMKSKPRF